MESPASDSLRIKEKAIELGFLDCGIALASYLEEDAARLRIWLENGYHGEMAYMENHFGKRTDPRRLVDGARSVIIVLQNYHTDEQQADPGAPRISRYAYGKDYHKFIRKKLDRFRDWIQTEIGLSPSRAFVDSAPVIEKALGREAGLGWIGRHSLLLNRRHGSWFFLGVIVTNLHLEPDSPAKDFCGDCTRCIDACPTGAILEGRTVDARKCISYLTIELRSDTIPEEFRGRMENRLFGCDICQEVCPWNNNARPHDEEWLKPRPGLLELTREDWFNMDAREFDRIFEGSAVKRAGYAVLRRNLSFLRKTRYTSNGIK
jgi:epoxyqueuosine reductase